MIEPHAEVDVIRPKPTIAGLVRVRLTSSEFDLGTNAYRPWPTIEAAGPSASLRRVDISSSGEDKGFIDRSLVTRGAKRRAALRVPSLLAGLAQAKSDLLDTLSRRAVKQWCSEPRWSSMSRH